MKEAELQSLCMQWVQYKRNTDERYWLIFAVPNGGKKSVATRVRHRKDGLLPGVSDILIFCPSGDAKFSHAAVELKVGKNSLSAEQVKFQDCARSYNSACVVIRDFDSFVSFVEGYFG